MSNGNGSITITPNLLDTVTAASALLVATQAQANIAVNSAAAVTGQATIAIRNIFYGIIPGTPPTRPDGSSTQDGDMYYNSIAQALMMRVFGAWQLVAITVPAGTSGALQASNNLADLSSIPAARSNLGLAAAALLNTGVANGVATLDSGGHLPLGQFSAANMGVPLIANNLSEMSVPTIRSNLGMGTAALLNSGTANGVATLNASGLVPMSQLNMAAPNGIATLNALGIVPSSQLPPGTIPTTSSKSTNYTTVLTDSATVLAFNTGSSTDLTCQLVAASTAGDGAVMYVQKVDSGTKKVIVLDSNGSTNLAWLSNQWDFVGFRSNGSVWTIYRCEISPRVDVYTPGSFTWTKPPLAVAVLVELLSAGGGGGAGGVNTGGTGVSGGSGGGGGGYYQRWYKASDVGSTENVTVGTGGASGGNGGNSSFGTVVKVFVSGGGSSQSGGGLAGFSATANGLGFEGAGLASSASGNSATYGGASGGSSVGGTTGRAGGGSLFGGAGGGSGGSVDSGGAAYAGGAAGSAATVTAGTGPAGGAVNAAGGNGTKPFEAGSGGGAGSAGSNGRNGGNGALGAGGGGGGACPNFQTAGSGGSGGNGQAWITTLFAA